MVASCCSLDLKDRFERKSYQPIYVQPRTIVWDTEIPNITRKRSIHMCNITKIFVGVDVSKKNLDVYMHPIGKRMRIANTQKDLKHFIQQLSAKRIEKVVFEASGGYEALLKKMIEKTCIKSWCVNPERISHFRQSEGIHAKSDTSDARVLALFGVQKQCQYEHYRYTKEEEKIRDWVNRRSDMIKMLVAEKSRLKNPASQSYASSVKKMIKYFEKEIDCIDRRIDTIKLHIPNFQAKIDILHTIPGIGDITAKILLSTLPELGSIGNKQACALMGVAPYTRRSGMFKGKEFIKGGRPVPRRALYMATLAAVRFNEKLKSFYQRLLLAGKKPKVALVAVMRKLTIIINALLRKEEIWNPII